VTTSSPEWDAAYVSATPPPWDIGRPQPAFVGLAERGRLSGHVLDAGCGTGEHTLLAAAHRAVALGVDVSPSAIERARRKAAERGVDADFEVADALALDQLGRTFDTIIDSGLFHVFDDGRRSRYAASLASVLAPGSRCYLMCFSDRQPGDQGPRRVREEEIRATFAHGWSVEDIAPAAFEVNPEFGSDTAQAWLATILRQ
jgi:cyclopropane fatty-acyl-phospholipid synthase-like methyltransferase